MVLTRNFSERHIKLLNPSTLEIFEVRGTCGGALVFTRSTGERWRLENGDEKMINRLFVPPALRLFHKSKLQHNPTLTTCSKSF